MQLKLKSIVGERTTAFAATVAVAATLAGLAAGPAQAAIISADIGKNLYYQQTGDGTYSPYGAMGGANNATFFARAFFSQPGELTGGVLDRPAPQSDLVLTTGLTDCCGASGVGIVSGYLPGFVPDAAIIPGQTYTLALTGPGAQNIPINVTAPTYASAPSLLDGASFQSLQNLTAPTALSLTFSGPQLHPDADSVQMFFTLRDAMTNAAVFSANGANLTRVDIGAGALTAGRDYYYEIIIDNVVASSFAGAQGLIPLYVRSDVRTLGFFSVAAVPEPGVWTMMVLGFGLVGGALRHRQGRYA